MNLDGSLVPVSLREAKKKDSKTHGANHTAARLIKEQEINKNQKEQEDPQTLVAS